MAVKVPVQYHGMYCGSMTNQQADLILQTRNLSLVQNLKNMIFNFPADLIKRSMDEQVAIRKILKDENIDWHQYISELRDYQTVGLAFMYLSPRSIIADGCGLGKSVEIAGLINYLKMVGQCNRFLIAVETSASIQMQGELIRFTGLNVVVLPSETAKFNKEIKKIDWKHVDGIVIKHSMLRNDAFSKWVSLNIDEKTNKCTLFDTLFIDESSIIKNNNTKIFNYTSNFCSLVNRVHLMNATVFEINILDIYNQLDMINQSLLPKKWRIEQEYCTHTVKTYWTKVNGKAQLNKKWDRTGYKNQEVFKKSLQLVYFGRSAKDVGKELPHIYKVYEIEPSNAMSLAINNKFRYNEVLNCPSLIPELELSTTRKNVPKLDRLCELIENEFGNDKVMVYCFHLEAQQAIKRELENIGKSVVILNGQCTDADRFEAQDGFNNGRYDVIVTNIKKSLNLYGGDVCIFYSMETNPSRSFQIGSRIDRHIDDKIKTFVLLLYKGTPEYTNFTTVVKQRAQDARDLTIDAKTTVDYFYESMIDLEQVV